MLAQEAQREADLVAEVDPIGARMRLLVGGVRGRELGLAGGPSASASSSGLAAAARRRRAARYGRADVLVAQPADERDQADRKRVGSPSGRYRSSGSSNRCSRRKMICSARLSTVERSRDPPRSACSRRSRSPNAWKVLIPASLWPYGTSRSTRSSISKAARSVNVSARISDGFARFSAISQAIRRVMTVVLPVPAPATIRSGPSPCVTALRWRAVRSASSGGWIRRCGRGPGRGAPAPRRTGAGLATGRPVACRRW